MIAAIALITLLIIVPASLTLGRIIKDVMICSSVSNTEIFVS
jgi:hypothetical protein